MRPALHFRKFPYAWLLTLVLLSANLWHFLHRDWEASYYPASYATIYYPTDRPVVKGWSAVEGGLGYEFAALT